jgi:hypothetical protein
MKLELAPYMDASFPIFFDSVKIVTHYPKVDNKSAGLVAIYSKTVNVVLSESGNGSSFCYCRRCGPSSLVSQWSSPSF